MPQLVNTQTNLPEEIGHEQLGQALLSGSHNLIKGESLDVIDADGKLVSLPAEQIPEAIQSQSFRFPTSSDIQEYQKEQQYGEGLAPTSKAAGAGFLRGATMGLSDQALVRSGITTPETLSELSKRHEIVTPISEVAGAGAALLLAPEAEGIGIAAKALQAARATGDAEKVALAIKALNSAKEVSKTAYTVGDLLNPVSAVNKLGNNITAAATKSIIVNPETSSTVAKILAGTSGKTLGSGVEGAAWGLGTAVDEHVLGDADLNAENLMHNVGYGALFAGALGGTLGLGENVFSKIFGKDVEKMAVKDATIENAAKSVREGIPTTPVTSLEEMSARNKALIDEGLDTVMPSQPRAIEINDILAGESNAPLHKYQVDSLSDPNKRFEYKMLLKSDTPEAKLLLDHEAIQKAEGANKLLPKFIQEISPEAKLADNAAEAGRNAVKIIEDQISAKKKELAPVFKQIDNIKADKIETPDRLWQDLFNDLPEAREVVQLNLEKGRFFLKPFDATLGITKETHSELKNLVAALNKDDLTLGGIRNVRKIMGARVNFLTDPETSRQLSTIRKSMMNFLQEEVEKRIPDVKVRDTFKRYAINEENKAFLERDVLRGRLGDKVELGKGISYEDVLPQFFQNSDTVRAAREVLGVKKFDELSANYLKFLSDKATDPTKGFSSNKMATALKLKDPELIEALSQHPESYKKIKAIIDKLRLSQDAPVANPSDTARGIEILKKIQGLGDVLRHPSKILDVLGEKIKSGQQRSHIDDILAGSVEGPEQLNRKQRMYGAFTKIERMQQQLTTRISRGAKSLFSEGEKLTAPASSELTPDEYDKTAQQIKDFSSDPEHFLNSVSTATESLHGIAPDIAGSLTASISRATQFLASKLPDLGHPSPMTEPYKPSVTEMAVFNRYYSTVRNPLNVFNSLKNGTLTHEQVETLQTVYPKMYQEMSTSILNQAFTKKSPLPYSKKLMISLFTGQDLDNSLQPQNIAAAQMTLNGGGIDKQAPQQSHALSKIDLSNQLLTPSQRVERNRNQS